MNTANATGTLPSRLRRWSVAAVGLALAGLAVGDLAVDPGAGWFERLAVVVPLANGLAVAGLGTYYARRHDAAALSRIAGWCLLCTAALALLGVWNVYLASGGSGLLRAGAGGVLTEATVGAVAGAVIGRYDVNMRDQHRQLRERERQLATMVDNVPVVLFRLDADGTFTLSEGMGLAALGFESGEVVGESIFDVYADVPGVRDAVERALDGERVEDTVALGDVVLETWLRPTFDDDGDVVSVTGAGLDVTERVRRDERLATLHEACRELTYVSEPAAVAEATVDIAERVLDKPLSALWRYDEATEQLHPVARSAATEAMLDDLGIDELDPIEAGSLGMEVYRSGELRAAADYATVANRAFPELPLGAVIVIPLEGYGVLEVGQAEAEPVSEMDRHHARILGLNAEAALDRAEREQELSQRQAALEALHAATRAMLRTSDRAAVCRTAVEAVEGSLDVELAGIWLREEGGERLVPAATTGAVADLVGEPPTYGPDEPSLTWSVYEAGRSRVVNDLRAEPGVGDPSLPVGSAILVPVGDDGVLTVAHAEPDAFDEADVYAVRLLAETTAAALEGAEQEQELRMYADQMEFFNSILRHDVLNGMTVIRARGEFLAEELDGRQREFADTIVEWCDDVSDVVERVRSVLEALTDEGERTLTPIDLSAVVRDECARVAGTYPAVSVEVETPGPVHVLADELLTEVVGNLVTNAVEHNEHEGLGLDISVRRDGDEAVLRVTDDGRGVPNEHKEAIFRREETGHAKSSGSGFGLFFVDTMIEAYGGSIAVEDVAPSGASFVVRLPAATGGEDR